MSKITHAIAIVVLLLSFTTPALAQESTETPVPPTDMPTVVAPTIEPTPVADDPPTDGGDSVEVPTDTLNLLIAGGFLLVAISQIASAIQKGRVTKDTKDAIERANQSLPPVWQSMIMKFLTGAKTLVDLGMEVTDGLPNMEGSLTTTVTPDLTAPGWVNITVRSSDGSFATTRVQLSTPATVVAAGTHG